MKALTVSFAVLTMALDPSVYALHQIHPKETTKNPGRQPEISWDGSIKKISISRAKKSLPVLVQQRPSSDSPSAIEPEKYYSFNELKQALEQSPESNPDTQAVFKFLSPNILLNLDQMGVKISYRNSFFNEDNQDTCSPAGTYLPSSKHINIYCRRPVSILLAESAHAIDAMLGQSGFRTEKDPNFQKIFLAYRKRIDRHIKDSGHANLKDHLKKSHPGRWDYLPGTNDLDPLLGPQGYDSIIELYMEGMIHFFYNPQKLEHSDSDLSQYIETSLNKASVPRTDSAPQGNTKPFILIDPI